MDDTSRGIMRIVIPVVLFVVGALAGWIGHGLVSAPADVAAITVYDDWRLACPAPSAQGSCAMVQDVVDARSHSEIAHMAIGHAKTGMELVVTMPFDILLSPGMGLSVGTDKVRVYPYQTCSRSGCIATIPVDDALRTSLHNAKQARLLFAMLNNRPVGLPFSLNGFARADDAFTNFESRRNSWWWRLWS